MNCNYVTCRNKATKKHVHAYRFPLTVYVCDEHLDWFLNPYKEAGQPVPVMEDIE